MSTTGFSRAFRHESVLAILLATALIVLAGGRNASSPPTTCSIKAG
jgi:hypothetical protein